MIYGCAHLVTRPLAVMSLQLPSETFRPKTCLVLGGARSGKSRYAQQLAEDSGRELVFLATAMAWDDEMRDRVAAHRRDRDERWRTVEEPLALAKVLNRHAVAGAVVLVDCLTLWLTNLMLGGHPVPQAVDRLAEAIVECRGAAILVSNEVGAGVVPDTPLGRAFRDEQGRLNQAIAARCDAAVLVVAGLPMLLKPSRSPTIELA